MIQVLGKDKPYIGKESQFQQAAMRFIRLKYDPYAFHVPNGGSRNAREGAKLKREGVLKGVCDIVSTAARNGFHGLYIELKVKGGKLSKEQRDFCCTMHERNYFVCVVWNMDELVKVLKEYFE